MKTVFLALAVLAVGCVDGIQRDLEPTGSAVTSIACSGSIMTMPISYAVTVSNGGAIAHSSVATGVSSADGDATFDAIDTDFPTAPVVVPLDVYGQQTGGSWTVSLDRAQRRVFAVYFDDELPSSPSDFSMHCQ